MEHPSFCLLVNTYGLGEEDCKKQISDDHLERISRSHCKNWRKLPAHLGLETIVAEDSDQGPGDEGAKRHKFFFRWKDIRGSSATYKQLINALLKIDSKQDAESVCKILKSQQTESASNANMKTVPPKGPSTRTTSTADEQEPKNGARPSPPVRTRTEPDNGNTPGNPILKMALSGGVLLAVVVCCAAIYIAMPPSLPRLHHSEESRKTYSEQPQKSDCHELTNVHDLEKFLDVDVPRDKLCHRLSLENCNVLKKLPLFNLAQSYLEQKPEACWENIVKVLCDLKYKSTAQNVAKKYGVDYGQHCPN